MAKPSLGFRNTVVSKTISILLLQTFLFYNTSFASIDKTPQPLTKDVKFKQASIDDIGISKDIGTIKTKYKGKDGKLLIHIQDAHCNYEAQTNISKILETLSKDYNINTISVEGADGYVDTAWFKSFPDAEIRKEVADYFMKKGEITGAEFLSITKDYPIKLYGAENRDLYIKNLNAFTQIYPHKQEIEKYLLDVKSVLGKLKGYIYSKDLMAFDAVTEDYKDKKKTLSDYAKVLSVQLKRHNLDLKDYPDFSKLVYTLVYEDKIDFKVVDQERANLIDAISKAVPKDKLQEMIVKSFSFKTGKVTASEYYEYLRSLAVDNGIDFIKLYPNLSNYVIYTKLYDKINIEHLFDEIDRIKIAVKDKLFENDDQRVLSEAWDNVNVLVGFINIKLSNKEYDYYKAHRDRFKVEFFTDFLKSKAGQYNLAYNIEEPTENVKTNIPQLETFYDTASRRDKVLVDNTVGSMKKEKADVAVLITGGFHTTGISKILEGMGISYIVVCPNITKDVESPYIQVLTNQKTPFEEILTESATPAKKDSLLGPYLLARKIMMRLNGDRGAIKALQGAVKQAGGEADPTGAIQSWVAFYVDRYVAAVRSDERADNRAQQSLETLRNAFVMAFYNSLDTPRISAEEKKQFERETPPLIEAEFNKLINAQTAPESAPTRNISTRVRKSPTDKGPNEPDTNGMGGINGNKFMQKPDSPIRRAAEEKNAAVEERRANIDRTKKVLTDPYNGYDVIIISSTTEGEAKDQEAKLRKVFEGIKTQVAALGNKVCILSILDVSEGNNLIGQNETWAGAIKAFKKWAADNRLPETDLTKLQAEGKVKIATYHNGGKAERFSPAGQALNLSRADQLLVGDVFNAQGKPVELNLLLTVILSTACNAVTNNGYSHDVYWANQIEFGTVPSVVRNDYVFNKFAVAVPANPNMKDLYDYGTLIASKDGRILKFLGNKRLTKKDDATGKYIPNPDWQAQYNELMEAAREGRAYLDYGSFSMSLDMQNALLEYWRDVKKIFDTMKSNADGRAGISREIDPHMTQIIVPLVNGVMGREAMLNQLPSIAELNSTSDKDAVLDRAYNTLIGIMSPEYKTALEDLYKKAKKEYDSGKSDNLQAIYETIEFFIRYKDKVNLMKGFGIIDFGPGSYWFAYKRLLDMGNEKFYMLSDIIGQNIELEPNGNDLRVPATAQDKIKAEDARRLRNIANDAVCVFEVNGQKIKLNAEQVRSGWEGYGVKVKGSVIQGNTVLLPGSVVEDSVINDSQGQVVAKNSYVDSSTAPKIEAKNSIVVNGVDEKLILANKEIVTDAFRPVIHDDRFADGHTRMRAPVGYDPKPGDKSLAARMSDTVKFGDNRYPFAEIRNMPCDKTANKAIENAARNEVRKRIDEITREQIPPTMSKRYQASKIQFARSTFGEQLVFGTSGIREVVKFLEDIKCYSIAKAIASYFNGMNEPDTIALAADLRPSSPRIAQDMILGNLAMDKDVVYSGNVPTPAVVNYGMYRKAGAVASAMVTASHCPVLPEEKHQNGIKPNRTTGEVLKEDERLILKHVREFLELEFMMQESQSMFDNTGMLKQKDLSIAQIQLVQKAMGIYNTINDEARTMYVSRYLDTFGKIFDESDEIDFIRHMAVGKDIITDIFTRMGAKFNAQTEQTKWEKGFIVDTEDLQDKLKDAVKDIAAANQQANKKIKGIFTTDGDSDRPALFHEDGTFVYGDKLGYLTCEYIRNLKAYAGTDTKFFVAVTATVGDAVVRRLQHIGFEVIKVKIGSPYVVKAMEDRMTAAKQNGENVVCTGFERNGGFLLGTDITLDNGKILKALPTRDAMLPIIAAFHTAKNEKRTIGQVFEDRFSGDFASQGWSGLVEAQMIDKSIWLEFVRKGLKDDELQAHSGMSVDEWKIFLEKVMKVAEVELKRLADAKETIDAEKNRVITEMMRKESAQLVAEMTKLDIESREFVTGKMGEIFGLKEICDKYTANMGQAIMRSFSPHDLDIVEVEFKPDGGVKYLMRDGSVRQAGSGEEFAVYMNNIKTALERHFDASKGFPGGIVKINYLDGVRMFFKNLEVVHMRPSGNAPQWRIYSEASTLERAMEITGFRLPVYPNIISEYSENKKQFEGVHIVPRTNDAMKKTFNGIFDQRKNDWITWEMVFGSNSEHSAKEGIVFGSNDSSVSFYRITVYDLAKDKTLAWLPKAGYSEPHLTVKRSITWDRKNSVLTCEEEWSDGRQVSKTFTGPDAWLEIGRGLDKNIPMGKFQNMPFPVMSDKAKDFFKQQPSILWLDLFDVSVESEFTLEAPMWAHNFNFKQAISTPVTSETPQGGHLRELVAIGTKYSLDSVDPDLIDREIANGATSATSNPIIISNLVKKVLANIEKNGGPQTEFEKGIYAILVKSPNEEAATREATKFIIGFVATKFRPVYDRTNGNDGYVSIEVDPRLEDTKEGPYAAWTHDQRVAEIKRQAAEFSKIAPNILIKIPATQAGLDSLEDLAYHGIDNNHCINLNVTLIFTPEQAYAARENIARGIERRKQEGESVNIKSVYSVFVSRTDDYTAKKAPDLPSNVQGEIGIYIAKLIYLQNKEFWQSRGLPLSQEMIFASTGSKSKLVAGIKTEADVLKLVELATSGSGSKEAQDAIAALKEMCRYVYDLAGDDIQTNPPLTGFAVNVAPFAITEKRVGILPASEVRKIMIQYLDSHMQELYDALMADGIAKFVSPQVELVKNIAAAMAKIPRSPAATPENIVKTLVDNRNPQSAVAGIFDNRQESEYLPALSAAANELNKHYANLTPSQRDQLWPVLEEFYSTLTRRAWSTVNYVNTARGLQIMTGNTIAIQNLIENGITGADKLQLTSDVRDMLTSKDGKGNDRGPSYISLTSVNEAGRGVAEGEGDAGLYWRGAEDITKLGANGENILPWAAYAANQHDEDRKFIMYTMLHVGGFHVTVFVNQYLPNSLQYASTGAGHWQAGKVDSKIITRGKLYQMMDAYDSDGSRVETTVTYGEKGDKVEAFSNTVDYMIPLSKIAVFNDKSHDLKIGQTAPSSMQVAPYAAINFEDSPVLVKAVNDAPRLRPFGKPHTENTVLAGQGLVKLSERVTILDTNTVSAIGRLNYLINAGNPLNVTSTYNLGKNGYKWGEKAGESFIIGLEPDREKLPSALAEAVTANDRVAERLIAAGTIDVGEGYSLPTSVLSSYFGQEPEITTKVLASAMPLSLQMHIFAEMIIPLEKGTAWIGVKENVTAEQLIEASREGRIQDVLQEVELEVGVPMIVPAYLPHAYGKVRVYEVKAVTPQEDATGTTSFFDRLKYLSPEMSGELAKAGASSIESITAEQLKQINTGRENKDVLTMDKSTLAKVRENLQRAERSGALNKTNIENLKFTPVVVSAPSIKNTDEARLEVMGAAEGRFITARYTVAENKSIQSAPLLAGRKHTLFVSEGEAELSTDQGVRIMLKKGQDITLTPNIRSYFIKSLKGTTVLYTQVTPKNELPATETARLAAQINNKQEIPKKNVVSEGREIVLTPNNRTSERLSVTSSAKQDLLQAKEAALSLEHGEAVIVKENGDVVALKLGSPIIVSAGMPLSIQTPCAAVVKVTYAQSREEAASFTAVNVIKNNLASIIAAGKIDLVTDDRLYQKDASYVNSMKKEQEFWKSLGIDVVLFKYNGELGLRDAARQSLRSGAIPVLIGTAENFQKQDDFNDPEVKTFLSRAKTLPPIDLAKIEGRRGWFFTREVEASAILVAATTTKNILDRDSIAEDLQKFMQKLTGLPIDNINDLLCTMSFEELQKLGDEFLAANGMPNLLAKINLIKRLLITLPPKPFDAGDDLHRRREVLWSV